MNFIIISIMTIYLIATSFFLYKFVINDMSLKQTLEDIKSCCFKKKEIVKEKIGEDKVVSIQEDLKDLEGNCQEPIGFPFDICFNGDLAKEDLILREKLLSILKNRKNVVLDGGKQKLVVPLEATLFLTKSLNPLVNEHGEIQIVTQHKKINDKLEEIVILLKNEESLIYKDEKELLNTIKELIEKESIEEPVEEVKEVIPEKKPELKEEKQKIEKRPIIKEDIIEDKDPFGENFEDPYINLDFNEIVAEEFNQLDDIQEEEIIDHKEFYHNLEYKTANKISPIDFNNLKSSIIKILSKEDTIGILFANIAKTKPIIFSENKSYLFVDCLNIYFAIAKLYGMNSDTYLKSFKKLTIEKRKELNKALEMTLDLYISDSVTGNKKVAKAIIEREDSKFYSYGFYIDTNAFKKGLSSSNFDSFRSFPYNNEYKLLGNISVEEKLPRLISSIEEVEIK